MNSHLKLTQAWIREVQAFRNPSTAWGMSAYMRHQFPFMGWPQALRRQHQASLWEALEPTNSIDLATLKTLMDALWKQPEREFQYTAMELALRCREAWTEGWLDLVYGWIQSKSWWDTVDWLAPKGLGWTLLHKKSNASRSMEVDQALLENVLARLHAHPNLWMQRSALILQLDFKDQTRFDLLCTMCLEKAGTKEFFLAKAMGWALRQYARHAPQEVRDFVYRNSQLPTLTRREALKHLA